MEIKSTSNGSGLYFLKTLSQFVAGILGRLYPESNSNAIFFIYSSEGVPRILMISINCSTALSPGNNGYFVKNSARMQPADHTSIYVSYNEYLNKS